MNTSKPNINHSRPNECRYALLRGMGYWALFFAGREAIFKHELGALYVAYLLLHPPKEPLHAVALALKARDMAGKPAGPDEVLAERSMGLEDAAAVRSLWRRQRELERVLADRQEIEPVKAEALRELEEVTEYLRTNPWRSRHGAERCVRAVAVAIKRFYAHLAGALDAEGRPDEVLCAFALHLYEHLLVPSGRGGAHAGAQAVSGFAGCFTYEPPTGVVWESEDGRRKTEDSKQKAEDGGPRPEIRNPKTEARRPISEDRRPAAVGYLARFLCGGLALALLATGCIGPRPLKGGKAVTTRKPAGVVEQTLVQGENPSQATKQDQESVKVRSFTVPAGSRVEQSSLPAFHEPQYERNDLLSLSLSPSKGERVPKAGKGAAHGPHARWQTVETINGQPSTTYTLSAPMPVVEREETRARTELGAAQKDTARELGTKLSSLKGIVWVGVGLFVFGLASLVWPPLKLIIGSVTTSAALMLGGLALAVLPTLMVGNELLILGGVGLAVGAWFLAHRHGELRGMVAASSADSVKRET